jgi:hypothetical protein
MKFELINWMADSLESCQDLMQLQFAKNLFEKVETTPEQKMLLTEVANLVEDRIRRQDGTMA